MTPLIYVISNQQDAVTLTPLKHFDCCGSDKNRHFALVYKSVSLAKHDKKHVCSLIAHKRRREFKTDGKKHSFTTHIDQTITFE